jgi:hypothetical protein
VTDYTAGLESQVNTYNSRSQYGPSVAALRDGGYVVTWIVGSSARTTAPHALRLSVG